MAVQTMRVVPGMQDRSNASSSSYGKKNGLMQPTQALVPEASHSATRRDIWCLAITIVIGGQYIGWNTGMDHGLFVNLLCFGLTSIGYITLCYCTAEISGALPFAGGAYGLARCTLGFYPAFLIGCCEALEYIMYVSTSVVLLGNLIAQVIPSLDHYDPLSWVVFYLSALFFHLKGGKTFWYFNGVLAVVSFVILLVYCLGSLPFVSFETNAKQQNTQDFQDGVIGFFRVFPLSIWFYVGVEALNLANDQAQMPKESIPKAQIAAVLTLFATGLTVFFVSVSLPPGLATLHAEPSPFDRGFTLMTHLSNEAVTMFSLPATYATAFGFMWCYGKLIAAMANSRLLPPLLGRCSKSSGSHYAALLAGTMLSCALCFLHLVQEDIADHFFTICALSAFMSYTGQCVGYIALRTKYKGIKSSTFRNPFGIYGAVVSMCIWILNFFSAAFYPPKIYDSLAFVGIVAVLTVYYFTYARHRQTFSAEENRVLLVAHILKFNNKKHHHSDQKRFQASQQSSRSDHSQVRNGTTTEVVSYESKNKSRKSNAT